MRNSTFDFLLQFHKDLRDAAVNAAGQFEVVTLLVPKKDKAGKVVLDEDQVPILVEKRLLKRDVIAAEWADRLKPYEDQAHDKY